MKHNNIYKVEKLLHSFMFAITHALVMYFGNLFIDKLVFLQLESWSKALILELIIIAIHFFLSDFLSNIILKYEKKINYLSVLFKINKDDKSPPHESILKIKGCEPNKIYLEIAYDGSSIKKYISKPIKIVFPTVFDLQLKSSLPFVSQDENIILINTELLNDFNSEFKQTIRIDFILNIIPSGLNDVTLEIQAPATKKKPIALLNKVNFITNKLTIEY